MYNNYLQKHFFEKMDIAINDGGNYSEMSKVNALKSLDILKDLFMKVDIGFNEFEEIDFFWNFGKNGMIISFTENMTMVFSGNIGEESLNGWINSEDFNTSSELYKFIKRLFELYH